MDLAGNAPALLQGGLAGLRLSRALGLLGLAAGVQQRTASNSVWWVNSVW